MHRHKRVLSWVAAVVGGVAVLAAQGSPVSDGEYVLGIEDQVTIQSSDAEEISKTYRIDLQGDIHPPVVGRVRAAGLTAGQLETALLSRLTPLYKAPQVSVSVSEFRSQRVSVLGSVAKPDIYQVQGRKRLFEVISLAGGLRQDAGNRIRITRRKKHGSFGQLPAKPDESGEFLVAEVPVQEVLDGRHPSFNVVIQPDDVITVPRAEMFYVVGSVRRSGGFVMGDNYTVSVLQALSLAEGLDRTAAPKNAKILRAAEGMGTRQEISVDLRKVLGGKNVDVALRPNDILFVPNSLSKNAALRSFEAAIQVGTGLAIYRF